MKNNWRVKLDGKGSSIIWDYPISKEALIIELLKKWNHVEIIE